MHSVAVELAQSCSFSSFAIKMLFHALRIGFDRMHRSVPMLGRPVESVEPQRLVAIIDDVVARARWNERRYLPV